MLLDRSFPVIPDFGTDKVSSPRRSSLADIDILFIGSDYEFNSQGLLDFLRSNADWLKQRRVAIAGLVCNNNDVIRYAESHSYVELFGFVEDLAELIGRSKLTVSPVKGTGLKIKLLDSIRLGTPAIASRQSLEGLPAGYEEAVFPIERQLVERLLDDPNSLETARKAALSYAARLRGDRGREQLIQLTSSAKLEQ